MTFVDTSVLVGVLLGNHPQHRVCLQAFSDCERPITNAHVLAETFATTTGFYRVPVEAASQLILELKKSLQIEVLMSVDYETAIVEAQQRGVMGGGIYDSLHATFARRVRAKKIMTRNPSHFLHVAPELEICVP